MTIHEARTGIGSEQSLWKGPDIKTAATVIIPAGKSALVPVILNEDSLPPLKQDVRVYPSVRSRYAQFGIDVDARIVRKIAGVLSMGTNGNKPSTVEVTMTNHGKRAIAIKESAKVFRLYSYSKNQTARRTELEKLVKEDDIKIEGLEGINWEWDINEEGVPIGIYVVIIPNSMRWIPPDSNTQPLVIDERVHDYRQVIDTLLQPAPQTDESILWIAETPKITLSTSVDAILDRRVVIFNTQGEVVSTPCFQINSRFIDGDKTRWPVRLEIVGPTAAIGGDKSAYVRFSFIERPELPSRN